MFLEFFHRLNTFFPVVLFISNNKLTHTYYYENLSSSALVEFMNFMQLLFYLFSAKIKENYKIIFVFLHFLSYSFFSVVIFFLKRCGDVAFGFFSLSCFYFFKFL